jgi:hypothetical protein
MHGFTYGFSILFHWPICLLLCQHHAMCGLARVRGRGSSHSTFFVALTTVLSTICDLAKYRDDWCRELTYVWRQKKFCYSLLLLCACFPRCRISDPPWLCTPKNRVIAGGYSAPNLPAVVPMWDQVGVGHSWNRQNVSQLRYLQGRV